MSASFVCSRQRMKEIPTEILEGFQETYEEAYVDHNELSSIDVLIQLQNLKVLDASYNVLSKAITPDFCQLSNLCSLNLSHNQLTEVFEFPYLPHLTHLDLSHNLISQFFSNAFEGVTSVQTLNLSQNQINLIPADVLSPLRRLYELNISSNHLSSIPSTFFRLNALRILNVQYNNIQNLSNAFLNRAQLQILIDGNPLSKMLIKRHASSFKPGTPQRRKDVSDSNTDRHDIYSGPFSRSSPPVIDNSILRKHSMDSNSNDDISEISKDEEEESEIEIKNEPPKPRFLSSLKDSNRLSMPNMRGIESKSNDESQNMDNEKRMKKLKKKLSNEEKHRMEVTKILMTLSENLPETKEEMKHNLNEIITCLTTVSKKGRKRASRRITLSTDIRQSAGSRKSRRLSAVTIQTPSEPPQNISKAAKVTFSPRLVTNQPDKPKSRMRRGKIYIDCEIDVLGPEKLSLAFMIEEDSSDEDDRILVGGEIFTLFQYLIYHSKSTENLSSFLCMYRNFTDSNQLVIELRKVVQLWIEKKTEDLHHDPIYQQICRIVQQWIEHYFILDFWKNAALLEKILEIISFLPSIASFRLQKLLEFKLSDCAEIAYRKPNRKETVALGVEHQIDLYSLSSIDVAKQLTILEFEMFQEIDPARVISSTDRKETVAIQKMIERFNITSHWVATAIVIEPEKKKRVTVIKFFLEVAESCLECNNFNTALAITAGLTISPISRLSKTWEAIPKKSQESFQKLSSLMDGHHNFANYREILNSSQLPCLPYFGIFLRDLTFIDDSFDNRLENGFANFYKMKRMSSVVQSIIQYQSSPFQFTVERGLYNFLKNVAPLPEDTLYKKSTQCEAPSEIWNL